MNRLAPRLVAAAAVVAAGLVPDFLLHDHHLVATFHATVNGASQSYRATTIPPWRDPLAVVCAFAAIAAAAWILGRRQRLELALGVLGCAVAGAVYVHQHFVHAFVCPPMVIGCPLVLAPPDLWHYWPSLLIMATGLAIAVVLMLPRSWLMVTPRLHPRRG